MASKKPTPKPRAKGKPPAGQAPEGDAQAHKIAATVALHPRANAVLAIARINGKGAPKDLEAQALFDHLGTLVEGFQKGELGRVESMLMSQAHTLDALFNRLLQRSLSQDMWMHIEGFMKLALRAQGNCRATLETLAYIKNPAGPTFVRQANIAHGPQQVNNGTAPPSGAAAPPRGGETANPPQQLLEHQAHEQWMDTGTTGAAAAGNSAMAPVGAIDRAQDSRGAHAVRRR